MKQGSGVFTAKKHKRLDGLIAHVYIDGMHRRQGRDVHTAGPLAAGLHSESIAARPIRVDGEHRVAQKNLNYVSAESAHMGSGL